MKYKIIFCLFISSSFFSSCEFMNQKSPLNIKIDEVESIKIYALYGQIDANYGMMEVDTTIVINKEHWKALIDNFNTATSKGLEKSIAHYTINVNLRNEETTGLRFTSGDAFKLEDDYAYPLTNENLEILKSYHDVAKR